MLATLAAPLVLAAAALAQNPSWDNSTRSPFTAITLNATDSSISAVFLPYGATLQSLFVPDRDGTQRDIVLGYDDPVRYSTDPGHPNFGLSRGCRLLCCAGIALTILPTCRSDRRPLRQPHQEQHLHRPGDGRGLLVGGQREQWRKHAARRPLRLGLATLDGDQG
jgi:hypothetical protein